MATRNPTGSYPGPSIWMSGREIAKIRTKVPTLSSNGTTYGPIVKFDFNQPQDHFTIEISHITDPQAASYVTAISQIGAVLTITDDVGKVWTGEVIGVGYSQQRGTELFTSVRISLESAAITDN